MLALSFLPAPVPGKALQPMASRHGPHDTHTEKILQTEFCRISSAPLVGCGHGDTSAQGGRGCQALEGAVASAAARDAAAPCRARPGDLHDSRRGAGRE